MIEVELPDGSIAEFPDGTAPDAIKNALRKRFTTPQTVAPGTSDREMGYGETAMDMLKSAGTGIAQGAIGLAGMPRDVGEWAGEKATGLIDSMMGASDEDIAARRQKAAGMLSPISAPSAQGMTQAVESAVGPMYQPQTTAGEYARTVGEFVPGAMMGPGGAIRKGAMAVVPGMASEAAGQATEGTDAEPYARFLAAIGGGFAAAGRSGAPMKQMIKEAPDMATVRNQKNALYKSLEQAGVKYDANAYGQWANQVASRLATEGLDPTLHPRASAVLKRVMDEVGNSPDFTKMETLRKIAGESTRSGAMTDAADINRAGVILKEIDNFFMGAPLISNGSIPAGQVNATAKQARELARRNIVARDIQEMNRKSQYYVSGPESGQRNQFANYMRSPRGKGLTPAEAQAFNNVVKREGVENVLHNTGSRLAQVGTMAAGVGSIPLTGALGPLVSGAAILGNMGARKLMEKVTDKRVRDALAVALAGRKAQSTAMSASKAAKADALVRKLLTTDSARRSAQEPMMYDANGRPYPYSALDQ